MLLVLSTLARAVGRLLGELSRQLDLRPFCPDCELPLLPEDPVDLDGYAATGVLSFVCPSCGARQVRVLEFS